MNLRAPIEPAAVHLCLDLQRLLEPDGPWPTPWMARALEQAVRLAEPRPEQTIFTRFMPPRTPDEMPGSWRHYFEKWRRVTREFIDPSVLELVPPLRSFVPPARVVDKGRYSAFVASPLQAALKDRGVTTLIVSGAETDMCVLATVLNAVDLGYRVIVSADAICSSVDSTHDALMTLYSRRFAEQIELTDTQTILDNWPRP
jgi:nicotinamidase-related amidase